ncbi:MAG: hypothetical protein K6U11_10770, partial [bacterium]|nr:hypothetical protein [bacterium]
NFLLSLFSLLPFIFSTLFFQHGEHLETDQQHNFYIPSQAVQAIWPKSFGSFLPKVLSCWPKIKQRITAG